MLRHQAHRLGETHCEVHSRPECTSCGILDEMCPVWLSQSSLCFGGLKGEVLLPAPRWYDLVGSRVSDELAQMLVHVAGHEKS